MAEWSVDEALVFIEVGVGVFTGGGCGGDGCLVVVGGAAAADAADAAQPPPAPAVLCLYYRPAGPQPACPPAAATLSLWCIALKLLKSCKQS